MPLFRHWVKFFSLGSWTYFAVPPLIFAQSGLPCELEIRFWEKTLYLGTNTLGTWIRGGSRVFGPQTSVWFKGIRGYPSISILCERLSADPPMLSWSGFRLDWVPSYKLPRWKACWKNKRLYKLICFPFYFKPFWIQRLTAICRLSWPVICDSPASASCMMGSQDCITTPRFTKQFIMQKYMTGEVHKLWWSRHRLTIKWVQRNNARQRQKHKNKRYRVLMELCNALQRQSSLDHWRKRKKALNQAIHKIIGLFSYILIVFCEWVPVLYYLKFISAKKPFRTYW